MRRQELDAFIRFALETLPRRTASTEEARAVLIAEGIITADGDLAAEYRPAGDSGKLLFLTPRTGRLRISSPSRSIRSKA
jgi:hypothetical protein